MACPEPSEPLPEVCRCAACEKLRELAALGCGRDAADRQKKEES